MNREQSIFLAKRNIIDSIYRESRLEGINVTFPETQEIYEGRTVAGLSVDETVVINNLKHACEFVLNTLDDPMDVNYLCKLHARVSVNLVLDAGGLRTGTVGIAGANWMPHIPTEASATAIIDETLIEHPSVERAMRFYARLARAQLFWDGNKRTAQLAANKLLIEDGFGVFSVPIDYIKLFNELSISFYDSGDPTELVRFLIENCITTLS